MAKKDKPKKEGKGFFGKLPPEIQQQFKAAGIQAGIKGSGKSANNALLAQLVTNLWSANQNANLNRPQTETTPYGSQTYIKNPDGTFSIRRDLSKEQQAILDQTQQQELATGRTQQGLQGQIDKNLTQPYSLSGVPGVIGEQNLQAERQRLEGELTSRYNDLNSPYWEKQRGELEQRLADQGITPGSPGYVARLKELQDRQGGERNQNIFSAIQQGGAEAESLFRRSMDARNQGISEYESQRYAPVNEFGQLQGFKSGVYNDQFQQMPGIDVGNVDIPGTQLGWYAAHKETPMMPGGGGGGGGYGGVNWGALLGGGGNSGGGGTYGGAPGGGWAGVAQGAASGFTNGLTFGAMNGAKSGGGGYGSASGAPQRKGFWTPIGSR